MPHRSARPWRPGPLNHATMSSSASCRGPRVQAATTAVVVRRRRGTAPESPWPAGSSGQARGRHPRDGRDLVEREQPTPRRDAQPAPRPSSRTIGGGADERSGTACANCIRVAPRPDRDARRGRRATGPDESTGTSAPGAMRTEGRIKGAAFDPGLPVAPDNRSQTIEGSAETDGLRSSTGSCWGATYRRLQGHWLLHGPRSRRSGGRVRVAPPGPVAVLTSE